MLSRMIFNGVGLCVTPNRKYAEMTCG